MPLEENAKIVLGQTNNDNAENEEMEITKTNECKSEVESKNESDNSSQESSEKKEQAEVGTPPLDETNEDACESDENQIIENVNLVLSKIEENGVAYQNLEQKVIQTLRENSNFQIQVRQNMQKELEEAKKKLSGDIFIPLLKEIAELYIEWRDVLNDLDDGVAKRKVKGIFEVLEEILEEYGCEFGTSPIDSKRRARYSKLKNKVLTGDKDKHETVAKSYNPWIVREPFVLYPEFVDIYVYDDSFVSEEQKDDIKESTKNKIQEEE